MPYVKNNYPEFEDVKFWKHPTINCHDLWDAIEDFITDPAHAGYRLIDIQLNFQATGPSLNIIHQVPTSIWASAIIIYTE